MATQQVPDLRSQVARLQQQVKEIQSVVKQQASESRRNKRSKVTQLSDEATEHNPYSRLMALKRMGVVPKYEDIRKYTVAIVGIGGVGVVAADELSRCGIGKLLLFDYDVIELANLNRLFFRPEQAGLSKIMAAKHTFADVNPDVAFETCNFNVTNKENPEYFSSKLSNGNIDGSGPVHLVLSCVDNLEARQIVAKTALDLGVPVLESHISQDAMIGHIKFLKPNGNKDSIPGDSGTPSASLPSTDSVVAGFLVQNVLKHLLSFGEVANELEVNMLTSEVSKK
eukprot:GFYU01008033.1.p1 GENE.GFYU01008033.1~~GFYU01008033.1.p1  ORF type:complete len:303 (-),score=78.94 GFYU01008033.1:114-962(-)